MAYPDLADVKTYLGVEDTDDDVRIAQIMVWTQSLIEYYLGRNLVSATYTQPAYKPKTELLQLRNYPVDSITSITIDDEVKTVSDFHLELLTGTVYGDFIEGVIVSIVYVGGYATTPSIVEDVYYQIVEDRYNDYLGINDGDVKDVTLFDFAKVSYDTSGGANRSLTYSGVGSSGTDPEPLANYLGMLDLYKSNAVLMSVAGIG